LDSNFLSDCRDNCNPALRLVGPDHVNTLVGCCLGRRVHGRERTLQYGVGHTFVFGALQGFFGGSMSPTAYTASIILFRGKQRPVAASFVTATAGLAPSLGPVVGGWITDSWSWQWLFYINIVPGMLVASLVPILVRMDRPDLALLKGTDYLGMVLMAVSLGCLDYVLEEGARWDWFGDYTIRSCASISGLAGIGFIIRCLTFSRPRSSICTRWRAATLPSAAGSRL
jgi:DHA2 family multidrug resistance protein